jgi:Ca-activated chloride channel family protein
MLQQGIACGFATALIGIVAQAASHPPRLVDFHTDADMVEVGATVLDGQDRVIHGLTQRDFRLFEDGVEQTVQHFGEEDVPVSLAIVFDVSGSMSAQMADARAALASLLRTSNPEDEFCLITFADRPEIAVPWTNSQGDIGERVLYARSNGRTALLDAVQLGMGELRKRRNPRRAMAIFSDGGDNHSRVSEASLLRMLEEADIQVYAVGLPDPNVRWVRPAEEVVAGPNLLGELCEHGGGRYFPVEGGRDLRKAADRVGEEIRSQYVLAYAPSRLAEDGKFHRLQVRVRRQPGGPRMTVRSRRGYRAPGNF